MSDNESPFLLHSLRKTKTVLLAASLTLAGLLIIMLSRWLAKMTLGAWGWLQDVPLAELGGGLVSAGFISPIFEHASQRDQELRFRQIIREEAPAMRDAVVEGFDIHPEA